jgi:MoxR-like ATPase
MASEDLEKALTEGRQLMAGIRREVGKCVVGQEEVVEGLFVALLAGGHVLMEGVPGLGKTLLVRTLAGVLDLGFKRVQCTPDLMPADVLGTTVLTQDESGGRRFEFQPGPVFTHVLLVDEINRATPKTQSALLEAMQESGVTVGGERRALEEPFFVMATQNPIEMEGTFPLPEAQLDRFLLKLSVTMPSLQELAAIIDRTTGVAEPEARPAADRETLLALRRTVREILLPEPVKHYALKLVMATNPLLDTSPEPVRRFVRYGASPRGAQALVLAAKVRAALDGRLNAAFDDVRWAALPALRHRIVLSFEGVAEGQTSDALVETVLAAVAELDDALAKEAAFDV